MVKTAVHPLGANRLRSSPILDKFLLPLAACAFALIVSPLLIVLTSDGDKTLESVMAVRYENKVFWPVMLALTLIVVFRHRERFSRASFPPNIICLFLYLAFAGVSVLWAFRPELSSIRFAQQVMVVLSVVLPAMLVVRSADILRAYSCASLLRACCLSFSCSAARR
jgi:exopolysaccharide production protein ExoQ